MKFSLIIKVILCSSVLLAFSSANAYYCSTKTKNGIVNIGDSEAQVRQACGEPTTISEEQGADNFSTVQLWLYDNVTVYNESPLSVSTPDIYVQRDGPTVVVEVTNDKITAITVGSKSVKSTSQCPLGNGIRIGDSIDSLISACGLATSVSVQNQPVPGEQLAMTKWQYDLGPYRDPLIMQFKAGKLAAINP